MSKHTFLKTFPFSALLKAHNKRMFYNRYTYSCRITSKLPKPESMELGKVYFTICTTHTYHHRSERTQRKGNLGISTKFIHGSSNTTQYTVHNAAFLVFVGWISPYHF